MSVVSFIQGLDAKYNSSTYPGGIYFATDTKTIYLDGNAYVGAKISDSKVVLMISWSDEHGKLHVQYTDGTEEYITIPGVTSSVYKSGDYIQIGEMIISLDYESVKNQIDNDLVNPIRANVSNNTKSIGEINTKVKSLEDSFVSLDSTVTSIGLMIEKHESLLSDSGENSLVKRIGVIETTLSNLPVSGVDTSENNGVQLTLTDGILGVVNNINSDTVLTTAKIGSLPIGSSIQTVLEDLSNRSDAAASGGVLGVVGGNGISVDSSVASSPAISIKIKQDSALYVDKDGLDIQWTENE